MRINEVFVISHHSREPKLNSRGEMRLSSWLAALPPRRTAISGAATSPMVKTFLGTGIIAVSFCIFAVVFYKRR